MLPCTGGLEMVKDNEEYLLCKICHKGRIQKNQTVRSYCLSRDCPKSCARHIKCCLQKPSQRRTSQQKSLLHNNISPSNIKYSF